MTGGESFIPALPQGSAAISREECASGCTVCPPKTIHAVRCEIVVPDDGLRIAQIRVRAANMPPCWRSPAFDNGVSVWRDVARLTPVDAVSLLGELA